MKKILILILNLLIVYYAECQVFTELLVPKYLSGRTAASANNARMPLFYCFQITGLTPNQAYDLKAGLALTTEAATSYGAGNQWNGSVFSTANWIGAFTTDASGNSGPVWGAVQPTGNATRFLPGAIVNLRIGYIATGGSMPAAPSFIGTKNITGLDIGNTAVTPATTDDGAFIQGSATALGSGKYVCAYDNTAGTGDPISIGLIRTHSVNQLSNNELPAAIDSILKGGTNVVDGDYALLIPIGSNNPNGVQRLEIRNKSNVVSFPSITASGIWPSGGNTVTVARRGVVSINAVDAPLPVKYTQFTADRNNDNIKLNWSTASEVNNNGFEIERSSNGTDFEKIGFVKGVGNSSRLNKYSFTDKNNSFAYYRLKQVDFDGKYEFSKVLTVKSNESSVELSPNPFNDNLVINSNTTIINAEIVDITGRVKMFEVVNSNTAKLNTSGLDNGVYFIRINNGEKVITKRIIKN
jgi:hypothetical protein